jgi:putative membrane protein
MKTILKVILLALLVTLITQVVPGVSVDAFWPTAVVAGIVLGFINSFVKPIAQVLAIPLTVLSFGLFAIVLNAILFWLIGPIVGWIAGIIGITMVFTVSGWFAAIVGGVISAIGTWILDQLFD